MNNNKKNIKLLTIDTLNKIQVYGIYAFFKNRNVS